MTQLTRQQFLQGGAALLATPFVLQGCAPAGASGSYEAAVKQTCRLSTGPFENEQALKRELVRCATFASSSHNTQKLEVQHSRQRHHHPA